MQHSTSRKIINSKDSLKMPCREEHIRRLSGQNGGQGRVWCLGSSHLQAEVGSWGTPAQPQPWARGYKVGPTAKQGRAVWSWRAADVPLARADGPCRLTMGSVPQEGWGEVREGRGTARTDGALGFIELSRHRQISAVPFNFKKVKPVTDIL